MSQTAYLNIRPTHFPGYPFPSRHPFPYWLHKVDVVARTALLVERCSLSVWRLECWTTERASFVDLDPSVLAHLHR